MNKVGVIVVAGALAALAVPAANAGSDTDRATGGGQILVGTRGAGDTIAFTARGTATAAQGQVQYVDRMDGTGRGQTTYHGAVACLDVTGNTAKIAGTWRDGGNFQLFVEDNGEGAGALASDVVVVVSMADEPACDFDEPDEEDQTALARGNAQVYDAP